MHLIIALIVFFLIYNHGYKKHGLIKRRKIPFILR